MRACDWRKPYHHSASPSSIAAESDKVIVAFADGTAVKFPVAHNNESECLPEKFLEW